MALTVESFDELNGDALFVQGRNRARYSADQHADLLDVRSNSVIVALDGSGDTDDIQEGVNLLGGLPGTVFVKSGSYSLLGTVSTTGNEQAIVGQGRGTVVKTTGNFRAFTSSHADCQVRNLKILGQRTAGNMNDGIWASGVGFMAMDLEIEKMGASGLLMQSSSSVVINCEIWDCADHGINCGGFSSMRISNNYVHDNDEMGMRVNGTTQYYVITTNVIKSNNQHGIFFDQVTKSSISGNSLQDNGSNSAYDGIHLTDNSDNNIIVANVVTASGGYGVEINSGGGAPDKSTVVANNLSGNGAGALLDNGTNTINANNQT